jgi:hypothetical protein
MSTLVRPVLSKRNKYYISKHRYYELKHFCLQYPEWKEEYANLAMSIGADSAVLDGMPKGNDKLDRTGENAVKLARIKENIRMVEDCARAADPVLAKWILKAVTDDKSFTYLKTVMNIPCERDMYYDR